MISATVRQVRSIPAVMLFAMLAAFAFMQVWYRETKLASRVIIADMRANSQAGVVGIDSVWDIAFALIFIGLLVPIGMSFINGADTSGWDSNAVLVWGLVGTLAILTIVYGIYKSTRSGGGGGGRRRGRRGGGM